MIRFASPQDVLKISQGEITDKNTINMRTMQPIQGGLHCQKIFGPIKDYSCACSPPEGLHGRTHKGSICGKCGVLIEKSEIRRYRFGHITLPVPVVNPLSFTIIADILHVNVAIIQEILKAKLFFGWKPDKNGTHFVSFEEIGFPVRAKFFTSEEKNHITCFRSCKSLHDAVMAIDIMRTLEKSSSSKVQKTLQHLGRYGIDLQDLFIVHLPVLPAGYRMLFKTKDGKTIDDPRNFHYQRIIVKSYRYMRLKNFLNVQIILEEEEALIQKAINELFFGVKDKKSVQNKFEGLIDYVSGKTGILRQNLLGKRVDFSGRSVISPDPSLSIDEVSLPIEIAYELFAPFIIQEIYLQHQDYKYAKSLHRKKHPWCYRILEKFVGRRILLNRQPTLHRLGFMSFKIKLHQGKTIKLPPLVCTPFNSDFDGDQMAVHLPISQNAEKEAQDLMSPEKNMLSPLNSQLSMVPSHEMIIGAFYMTNLKENKKTQKFRTKENALRFYECGAFTINEIIFVDGQETCAGRILIENIFGISIGEPFSKKNLRKYLSEAFTRLDEQTYARSIKDLQDLTFHYATKSGFSLGMDDFLHPSTRKEEFQKAKDFVSQQEQMVQEGSISKKEKYKNVVRHWKQVFDKQDKLWVEESSQINPLAIMLRTGSRVSLAQVSQLVMAKGLQARADGYIKEYPVLSSLREGLNTFDYFRSCTGARKSMYDKKNVTPISGYLARRLVTASRDFYISMHDCQYSSEGVFLPFEQTKGRFIITPYSLEDIKPSDRVLVRSPVFCKAREGICAVCYGFDLTTGKQVKIGTPVGVIAAQSLTEPATQLSMRVFHTAGAVELGKSPFTVFSERSGKVTIVEKEKVINIFVGDAEYFVHREYATLLVKDKEKVTSGTPLALYTNTDLKNEDISGALESIIRYYEMSSHPGSEAVVAKKGGKVSIHPSNEGIELKIEGEVQGISINNPILVYNGQTVYKGQFLTKGEINLRKMKENDFMLISSVFVNRLLQIYNQEGIYPSPIHLEVIFRSLSEFVKMENGCIGLLRYGEKGERLLNGAKRVGRYYPSWLKALCFGFVKSSLIRTAFSPRWTYDLPSERLLIGESLFERKNE